MTSFVGGRPAADAMKPSEQSSERAKRDPETPAQSGIPGTPRPRPNSRSSVQFRASRASPARRCSVRSETEDHWPATRGPDGLATPPADSFGATERSPHPHGVHPPDRTDDAAS